MRSVRKGHVSANWAAPAQEIEVCVRCLLAFSPSILSLAIPFISCIFVVDQGDTWPMSCQALLSPIPPPATPFSAYCQTKAMIVMSIVSASAANPNLGCSVIQL